MMFAHKPMYIEATCWSDFGLLSSLFLEGHFLTKFSDSRHSQLANIVFDVEFDFLIKNQEFLEPTGKP